MLQATSLSRRLLLAASVFIGAALVIAGVVLFFVLHRFVQGQIDQRLDTQIAFLSSMLRSQNGVLTLAGNADGPPFDGHPRGWYWEAIGPNNTLRSRALGDRDLNISKIAVHPPHRLHHHRRRPMRTDHLHLGHGPRLPTTWGRTNNGSISEYCARRYPACRQRSSQPRRVRRSWARFGRQ